jgi:aryl-alcohol dehydrogenase (NADP+)
MYFQPEDFDVLDAVLEVARRRERKPAQVALAWLLAQPGVSAPIVGASKVAHLDDLAEAVSLRLTDEETSRLEAAYKPHPVHGHTPPTPRDVLRSR